MVNNKVVISLIDTKSIDKYFTGIYDMISGELKILDEKIQINYVLGKNNLVFAIYAGEAYLAEVKEDSSVELLYSLSTDEQKCIAGYGIINEAGDTIFGNKYMSLVSEYEYVYGNGMYIDGNKVEDKYSFIHINNKY